MTAPPARGVVLRGGPRDVLVTDAGVALLPPAAVTFLRAGRTSARHLHQHLIDACGIDPAEATVATAKLRQAAVVGDTCEAPVIDLTLVDVGWTPFAITPALAAALARAVVGEGRRVIVEFGSGVSTIALAAAAAVTGEPCTVVSFEESSVWSAKLRESLKLVTEPLVDVEIVDSPLVDWVTPAPLAVSRWYDASVVRGILEQLPAPVDLVVVDGPSAFQQQWQFDRYPALPVVQPFLAHGARILLDDTGRPGEVAVLGQWLEELGVAWETVDAGRASWLSRTP